MTTASAPYSRRRIRAIQEEQANLVTHALGLVLSVAGTIFLMMLARERGDFWQILGCSVYGATLVALYAASTLSHSFPPGHRRHFFRMVDQICIFLLIAGTYTPFGLVFLREGWMWIVLVLVWGFALLGIFFKVFFSRLRNVSTMAYIMLGWLPAVGIGSVVERVPGMALVWVLLGGILYTLGTLFLACDQKYRYFHAVWHLFVIAASACHYLAVLWYVIPPA